MRKEEIQIELQSPKILHNNQIVSKVNETITKVLLDLIDNDKCDIDEVLELFLIMGLTSIIHLSVSNMRNKHNIIMRQFITAINHCASHLIDEDSEVLKVISMELLNKYVQKDSQVFACSALESKKSFDETFVALPPKFS